MPKSLEALIARKGNAVTGDYYLAECGNCEEMFSSERMTGGEALYAGDYGDSYCPHCGAADCDISDYGDVNSDAALAWNYQQKHIDALIAALEQAQQYAKKRDDENADLMMTIGRLRVERESLDLAMREAAPLCVKLPDRLQPGADGYDDWYLHSSPDGEYMKVDDVVKAIRSAGGIVEGAE